MSEVLVRASGLAKSFEQGSRWPFARVPAAVRAVDDVTLEISRGETLALVGESGCGKSTLGRLLLRLIEPSAGTVHYGETELTSLSRPAMRRMRRHLQMVFQDPYGSLSPRRTVAQIIAEPLEMFGLAQSRREAREKVADLLVQVGLPPSTMDRLPRQFSGGQRQRIGIARAISVDPGFIVADEPVSSLDVSIQAQIVNLLQDLQERHRIAYLFIAHDLAVVRHIADRVAVMYLGRIVEIGPKDALYGAPLHPYTQALLSAAPEPDPRARRRRIVLQGDVPSPSAAPPGCAFHPRCPIATRICREQRPALTEGRPGNLVACHHAGPNPIPLPATSGT